MKRQLLVGYLVLTLLLLLFASVEARATSCSNGSTNYPKCDNRKAPPKAKPPAKPQPQVTTTLAQQQAQQQAQRAVAGAAAGATGGTASSDQQADQQVGLTLQGDQVDSLSWSLFLPPPVATPPMPRPDVPVNCPPPTETQDALAVGSGVLFSRASSLRDNDPCTSIKFSQMYWDRCQYQKADRALAIGMKLFARKAGEDWDAQADQRLRDFEPEVCTLMHQPQPIKEVRYVQVFPPAQAQPVAQPVACPKGQRRNSKGQCYTPAKPKPVVEDCEAGKVQACVPKTR